MTEFHTLKHISFKRFQADFHAVFNAIELPPSFIGNIMGTNMLTGLKLHLPFKLLPRQLVPRRVRLLLLRRRGLQSLLLARGQHEQLQEPRALPQVALRFLSAPRRGHQEAPLDMISMHWEHAVLTLLGS